MQEKHGMQFVHALLYGKRTGFINHLKFKNYVYIYFKEKKGNNRKQGT